MVRRLMVAVMITALAMTGCAVVTSPSQVADRAPVATQSAASTPRPSQTPAISTERSAEAPSPSSPAPETSASESSAPEASAPHTSDSEPATPAPSSATPAPSAPAPSASRTVVPPATRPSTPPSTANPSGITLVQVVSVTDGDTIRVDLNGVTERVRLIGLNAPELNPRECFGQQAASKMQSLVQSKQVRLTVDHSQADRDVYGRLLRHVWLTDGRSVALEMISGGYAAEYTYAKPYLGRDRHRAAEQSAKAKKLGLWGSQCAAPTTQPPATKPPTRPPATKPPTSKPAVPGKCLIKGNISSKKEKIYHVPGGRDYDKTVITESKGERWFCTEADAVNAGWRKSKR